MHFRFCRVFWSKSKCFWIDFQVLFFTVSQAFLSALGYMIYIIHLSWLSVDSITRWPREIISVKKHFRFGIIIYLVHFMVGLTRICWMITTAGTFINWLIHQTMIFQTVQLNFSNCIWNNFHQVTNFHIEFWCGFKPPHSKNGKALRTHYFWHMKTW